MIDFNLTQWNLITAVCYNLSVIGNRDKYNFIPDEFSPGVQRWVMQECLRSFYSGGTKFDFSCLESKIADKLKTGQLEAKAIDIARFFLSQEPEDKSKNIDMYYKDFKKYSAVIQLSKQGFDLHEIAPSLYLEDDAKKEALKGGQGFGADLEDPIDKMQLNDIFNLLKRNLGEVESKYVSESSIETTQANTGVRALLAKLKATPEVGQNLQGEIFNTVVRGARPGKYYLRSAGTGVGKTRSMVGDACYSAYPMRYDWQTESWISFGGCQKVLFIGTEQKADEIQTMVLSYLSGVNEEKIISNNMTEMEEYIVNRAADVMDVFADNLTIVQIADPDITSLKSTVRYNVIKNNISEVYYDYIFTSPKLMSEFRDVGLREDVVLSMMSSALKDLAVELDVFIMSATQLNGEAEKKEGIKDQTLLRGSKACADKADVGCITMVVNEKEKALMETFDVNGVLCPNQVTDIYKNRRGRYTRIRVWAEVDLGTCRKRDLFVTDASCNPLKDFEMREFDVVPPEDIQKTIEDSIEKLNAGEPLFNDQCTPIEDIVNEE